MEWLPSPVFLPGEFQGQRSLADYSSWGCTESDMTEQLTYTHTHAISQALFLTTAAPTKCEIESPLNFHCPAPANSTLAVLLLFD